jgi:type IV secretory pathway TrbD component
MKLSDYSVPVHRSLQEPDAAFGVGTTALLLVFTGTIVLSSLVSIWCILLGAAALIVLRALCREDPFLVDILIENLFQKDRYEG